MLKILRRDGKENKRQYMSNVAKFLACLQKYLASSLTIALLKGSLENWMGSLLLLQMINKPLRAALSAGLSAMMEIFYISIPSNKVAIIWLGVLDIDRQSD